MVLILSQNRAHPRSRGEHDLRDEARGWCRGSSPLARGTPRPAWLHLRSRGLIPARAGNTSSTLRVCYAATAHPRSRGEHGWHVSPSVKETGSSPLARGTRPKACTAHYPAGLIPARAGNTVGMFPPRLRRRAHPRSRGEHDQRHVRLTIPQGSSPLARGTQVLTRRHVVFTGLIPARAGNTC